MSCRFCIKNESWENHKTCNCYVSSTSLGKHLSAAINIVWCFKVVYYCQKKVSFKSTTVGRNWLDLSVFILIYVGLELHFLARNISYFMSLSQRSRRSPTLNCTSSSFWRHVRDRPLVPVPAHVSSQNTRLWIWPENIMALCTMLERPSDCPQAQTLYGIPFLCLLLLIHVLYMSVGCMSLSV